MKYEDDEMDFDNPDEEALYYRLKNMKNGTAAVRSSREYDMYDPEPYLDVNDFKYVNDKTR